MNLPPEKSDQILAGRLFVELCAIAFAVSRSSGPGGQNVNKVNTRIELRMPISAVQGGTPEIMQRLRMLAGKRLTLGGDLRIVVQETRSLESNRALAIEQLKALFEEASRIPKKRHATKPSKASRRRRVENKRRRGDTKASRRGDDVG